MGFVVLGGRSLADFTQPLEMLQDCHRRIEHFLQLLQKVVDQFGGEELNDEGRRALETSLTYFSHAAPRHTADEEESLFPRMRSSDDPAVGEALAELDGLEADHRRADALHKQVDHIARQWLATGRIDESQRHQLQDLLAELAAIYAAHIRLEDERVFALASRVLTADELQQVGKEMRERRLGPG